MSPLLSSDGGEIGTERLRGVPYATAEKIPFATAENNFASANKKNVKRLTSVFQIPYLCINKKTMLPEQ